MTENNTLDYEFRQIASSEINLLKDLLTVFAAAFEDSKTYQSAIPSDSYLKALLEKPHFIALVALCGDEVVGGLAAFELDKFEQDRREIYIYDLVVARDHRRKGIATNLILELRRIAEGRGVYVIFVQADKGDIPAIKLYKSLGTMEEVLQFDIPVD